jgi:hypothetical protein
MPNLVVLIAFKEWRMGTQFNSSISFLRFLSFTFHVGFFSLICATVLIRGFILL